MNKFLVLVFLALLTACAQTQILTSGQEAVLKTPPTLEDQIDFYLFGFLEATQVNLQKVCGDQAVLQIESLYTFEDGLISIFTFGIYSPKTYRVWCTEEGS